jgi:hypothetical protein
VPAPAAVPEATDSVKVLVPLPGDAMLAGASLAVTPFGVVLTDKAMAALNPFTRAVVRVIVFEPSGATLALVALGVSVKLGGGSTVRLNVWVFVAPPPTAARVRVETPAVAVEPTDSVKVLLPLPGAAMLVRVKFAVTLFGSPLTDKATAELNPVPAVVVNVMGTEPPGATLALVALDVSVKLGVATARMII